MKAITALVVFSLLLSGPTHRRYHKGTSTKRGLGTRQSAPRHRSAQDLPRPRTGEHFFRVRSVTDGDTLRIDEGERVRLLGVDTPETRHPRKPVQYFGKEASAFTKREIHRRLVRMEHERVLRDRYGRLLAYVYRQPDEWFLNAELIRQGYGFAYTRFPFRHLEEFRGYEREARERKRGLWAERQENAR